MRRAECEIPHSASKRHSAIILEILLGMWRGATNLCGRTGGPGLIGTHV